MKACSLIRSAPHYRADAFASGLKAIGATSAGVNDCDVLVIWNRYGGWDKDASRVEARGGTVLVVENGYLGNEFAGDRWYAISRSQHNGAGTWRDGGPDRWDSLGVGLAPWRDGREVVVLPQRGIGPMGVAMPARWTREAMDKLARLTKRPVRVRDHPGVNACKPLEDDLADAYAVVTWGSGAAIKALAMGVPVFADFPQWIGMPAARPFGFDMRDPLRSDAARLGMFRRMAWAQWRLSEIANGEAFKCLMTTR